MTAKGARPISSFTEGRTVEQRVNVKKVNLWMEIARQPQRVSNPDNELHFT
jgi:hypothetical protein